MSLPNFIASFDDVINQIRSGEVKNIGVTIGAGISRNSGIGDYRSKGGLYDVLDATKLTIPEDMRASISEEPSIVASKECFEASQLGFLEVKRRMILHCASKLQKPSAAHRALSILHRHNLIHNVVTQNIDGLEISAGLPESVVTSAHGSLSSAVCHYCKKEETLQNFAASILTNIKDITNTDASAPQKSTEILCKSCNKPGVRPNVILYGEELSPEALSTVQHNMRQVDTLFVVGTSLTVTPLALLPQEVPDDAPRVVFDTRPVGESVGLRYGRGRDVLVNDIDTAFIYLLDKLGYLNELKEMRESLPEGSLACLERYEGTMAEPDFGVAKQGRRVEVIVQNEADLMRCVTHSREAAIMVPKVGLELSSYVTSGQRWTLKDFIACHAEEVRKNMQMVMWQGNAAAAVAELVRDLGALLLVKEPWRLVVDDPMGEAEITKTDADTAATHRVTEYVLTEREGRLVGR